MEPGEVVSTWPGPGDSLAVKSLDALLEYPSLVPSTHVRASLEDPVLLLASRNTCTHEAEKHT